MSALDDCVRRHGTSNAAAELAALREQLGRWKKAVEGLTPSGSEFVDDPERCAEYIRGRIQGPKQFAALRERVKRLEEALSRARKIDWESVADRIDNPGDYIGDEQTAKNIRKFAAALEQP